MKKELLSELIEDNDEKEYIEFKTNYMAERHYKEIGEYISVKRNRSKLINAAMLDMKNQLFEIAQSESTGPTITAIIAAFKLRISKEAEVLEILSDTELSKLREIECLADADKWSKEELYENLRKRLSYMYN